MSLVTSIAAVVPKEKVPAVPIRHKVTIIASYNFTGPLMENPDHEEDCYKENFVFFTKEEIREAAEKTKFQTSQMAKYFSIQNLVKDSDVCTRRLLDDGKEHVNSKTNDLMNNSEFGSPRMKETLTKQNRKNENYETLSLQQDHNDENTNVEDVTENTKTHFDMGIQSKHYIIRNKNKDRKSAMVNIIVHKEDNKCKTNTESNAIPETVEKQINESAGKIKDLGTLSETPSRAVTFNSIQVVCLMRHMDIPLCFSSRVRNCSVTRNKAIHNGGFSYSAVMLIRLMQVRPINCN